MPLFTGRGFNQAAGRGFEQGFGLAMQLAIQKRTEEFQRERDAFRAAHEEKMVDKRAGLESADAMARFERERGAKREDAAVDFGRKKELANIELQNQDSLMRSKANLESRRDEERRTTALEDPIYKLNLKAEERRGMTAENEVEISRLKLEEVKRNRGPIGSTRADALKKTTGLDISPDLTSEDVDFILKADEVADRQEARKQRNTAADRQAKAAEEEAKTRRTQAKLNVMTKLKDSQSGRMGYVIKSIEESRQGAIRAYGNLLQNPDESVREMAQRNLSKLTDPNVVIANEEMVRSKFDKSIKEAFGSDPEIQQAWKALEPEDQEEVMSHVLSTASPSESSSAESTNEQSKLSETDRERALRLISQDQAMTEQYLGAPSGAKEELLQAALKDVKRKIPQGRSGFEIGFGAARSDPAAEEAKRYSKLKGTR